MSVMKDMVGKRFGFVTVICPDNERTNAKHQKFWICKCDCGTRFSTRGDNLRRGIATKCSMCSNSGRRSHEVL